MSSLVRAIPLVLSSVSFVAAAGFTPLASIKVPYATLLPENIEPNAGPRGPAIGYNRCNSTTEGPNSLCQTMFVNSIDDFCLWAPQKTASIADTEAAEIAWCTKPGHGTRIIPPGALTGVQYLRMPDYIQIVGFIDQTKINIPANDDGGELDPHGADEAGNPIGALVYSNAFSGDNNTFTQIQEWTNFMGGNQFCIKVCKPNGRNPRKDCEHIYDRIGCEYNAPNAAQDKVFETCDAVDSDFVGLYTQGGQTLTYHQPPEAAGAIQTMPYVAKPPASSNCVSFSSAEIYAAAATAAPAPAPTSSAAAASSAAPTTGASSGAAAGTPSGSKPAATGGSPTTAGGAAATPTTNGALSSLSAPSSILSLALFAAVSLML